MIAAVLAVAFGLAGPLGSALAQQHPPPVWERASEPWRSESEKAHRAAQFLLMQAQQLRTSSPMGQEQLARALHILDEAHAHTSPDVRLRFDAGRVLSLLNDYTRAAPVLESALREAPNHPLATDAFFSLAICYAKQNRPEEEVTVYEEYLRRETDSAARAGALSNRGEAQMLMGRLLAAVADYRASLALEPDGVFAHWGLSVALDRSGDTPGALAEAKAAILFDPLDQQLESPNWFFVPPYDRYWYEALGAMARARDADDAASSIVWWDTARGKWRDYAAFAPPDDRWLALARAHLASCELMLTRAKKRASQSVRKKTEQPDQP